MILAVEAGAVKEALGSCHQGGSRSCHQGGCHQGVCPPCVFHQGVCHRACHQRGCRQGEFGVLPSKQVRMRVLEADQRRTTSLLVHGVAGRGVTELAVLGLTVPYGQVRSRFTLSDVRSRFAPCPAGRPGLGIASYSTGCPPLGPARCCLDKGVLGACGRIGRSGLNSLCALQEDLVVGRLGGSTMPASSRAHQALEVAASSGGGGKLWRWR